MMLIKLYECVFLKWVVLVLKLIIIVNVMDILSGSIYKSEVKFMVVWWDVIVIVLKWFIRSVIVVKMFVLKNMVNLIGRLILSIFLYVF